MNNKVIETLCEVREMTVDDVAEAVYLHKYKSIGGMWEAVETKDFWYDIAKALAKLGTIRVVGAKS